MPTEFVSQVTALPGNIYQKAAQHIAMPSQSGVAVDGTASDTVFGSDLIVSSFLRRNQIFVLGEPWFVSTTSVIWEVEVTAALDTVRQSIVEYTEDQFVELEEDFEWE